MTPTPNPSEIEIAAIVLAFILMALMIAGWSRTR